MLNPQTWTSRLDQELAFGRRREDPYEYCHAWHTAQRRLSRSPCEPVPDFPTLLPLAHSGFELMVLSSVAVQPLFLRRK